MAKFTAFFQICVFAFGVSLGISLANAQTIPIPIPRPDYSQNAAPPPNKPVPPDPPRIYQAACPALLTGLIQGRIVKAIDKEGCGTLSPLAVTALGKQGEIRLSGEPVLNCRMATALADWATEASQVAEKEMESKIAELANGPGYDCRRRNRSPTGKFSEHAFANAIDISSILLGTGERISIENHWPHLPPQSDSAESVEGEEVEPVAPPAKRAETPQARFLTGVHELACKRFSTVLGPDANAAHRSHFHFDLGCHGRDCTYLICE